MAKRLVLISLLMGLLTVSCASLLSGAGLPALASEAHNGDLPLKTTVLITMYGFIPAQEQDAGILSMMAESARAKSLGTLVIYEGQRLIVTHDHSSLANEKLELVQFHDARQELVAQITGSEFIDLILYRDGGTLVLRAPASLDSQVNAVLWQDTPSIGPGAIVQVVHRNNDEQGGIGVMEASVDAVETTSGAPTFVLRSLEGHVIAGGDSGGGIWHQGHLVGNMWRAIVAMELGTETAAQAGESEWKETHWSRAAVLTENIQDQVAGLLAQAAQADSVDAGVLATATLTQQPGLAPTAQDDGIH